MGETILITLTELAATKVKALLEKRGHGQGIRIGVRTTGCSGLAYTLEYVDTAPATRDQFKYESRGVTVWIDGKSHVYVDGMTVDWKREGLNEGFDFINEKEAARCGCGESFTI
jgi:iron-sulfur cluster assembly protein